MELTKEDLKELAETTARVYKMIDEKQELSASDRAQLHDIAYKILEEGYLPSDALGMTAEHHGIFYNNGYELFEGGKYKDAYAIFNVLCTLYPDDSASLLSRGVCLQYMHRYEEAIESYLASSFFDKEDPLPSFYAAECYRILEEPYLSVIMLDKTIRLCGDKPILEAVKTKAELLRSGLLDAAMNQKEPGKAVKAMRERDAQWHKEHGAKK